MNQPATKLKSGSYQPLTLRHTTLIWILLTSSTCIYYLAQVEGAKFGINLSPFDVIVLIIVGICIASKRIVWPQRSVWVGATALLLILGVHTVATYNIIDTSIALLAKGSLKLAAFITLTSLLVVLFSAKEMRHPPFKVIAAVFIAISTYLVLLGGILIPASTNFIPLTNLMSALVGTMFLLVVSVYYDPRDTRRLLAGGAAAITTAIAILLHSKGFTLVGIGFFAVILLDWRREQLEKYTRGWRLLGVLALIFVVGALTTAVLQQFELSPVSTDTIMRSISIRGGLWKHAIEVGSANFPWGIGAGQFAVSLGETCQSGKLPSSSLTLDCSTIIIEEHEVAHNTALTWFAEFGILGLILAIGVISLTIHAAMSWPGALRLLFLLYLSVPLILHDGHGLRMVMLILGLGIANAIYPSKLPPQEAHEVADT